MHEAAPSTKGRGALEGGGGRPGSLRRVGVAGGCGVLDWRELLTRSGLDLRGLAFARNRSAGDIVEAINRGEIARAFPEFTR